MMSDTSIRQEQNSDGDDNPFLLKYVITPNFDILYHDNDNNDYNDNNDHDNTYIQIVFANTLH